MDFLIQAASSLGAGVLASFSPCVYPMVPITLGYFGTQAQEGKKRQVLSFVFGQIIAFTALGVLAVSAGQALGFSSQDYRIQIFTGFLLLLFGFLSLSPKASGMLSRINLPFSSQNKNRTVAGAFIFGLVSAVLISPCTTPILSGVLSMVATQETFSQGAFYMFLYSLGFTLLFLVLGLGMMSSSKLPRSGQWLGKMHKIGAIALILAGFFYLYNGASLYFEG